MKPVTIVTGNTKKFQQIQEALQTAGIPTIQKNVSIHEIQSLDGAEVVRAKALQAYEILQEPVLVDDTGFYVKKYNQFPGILAKFVFAGIGYDGLFKLMHTGDAAWFHCFVGYMDGTLSTPHIVDAMYEGIITDTFEQNPQEEMPYAPLFIPHGSTKTMAEMTPQERALDHRHTALAAFSQWYTTHVQQQQ